MNTINKIYLLKDKILEIFNKNKALSFFLLFFPHVYHIILPNGSIAVIEYIFVRLRIISFLVLIILFILLKKKLSKLFIILIITDFWIVMNTIINNSINLNKAILYVCSSIAIALIVEIGITDVKSLISGILPAFEIHIYPNLLTVLLYRNILSKNVTSGYHENNFFLGTKNDLILYLLPAFFICIIYYYLNKKILRPALLSTAILLTVVLSKSITTLLSFIFMIVICCFIYFVRKNKINSVYFYVGIPILILIIIVIPYIISGHNAIVDFIMNNIYYRHSFISRTAIWVNASEYVKAKPLMGYGYINTSLCFVDDIGRMYYGNAHCDLIQRILNYGIIGLIMFIVFNLTLLNKLNKAKNTTLKTICVAFICGIYLTFISQTYHRFFEFYLILFIINNIEILNSNIENNN